jgi:hypothetical protein
MKPRWPHSRLPLDAPGAGSPLAAGTGLPLVICEGKVSMLTRIAAATVFPTLLLAAFPSGRCFSQGFLQFGMDGVGFEANNATGPLLYREVPEAQLMSVRAKISNQSAGLWSQAGVIARVPNTGAGENWQISWSFRAPIEGPFQHQSNQSLNGAEDEDNDGGLRREELNYVRLDNMGGGVFQAYRGTGPDDNNITWTPQMAGGMPQTQTNANLVGQTLQVGLAAGAIGALEGASVLYDWVEIQTASQTFRDDFTYSPTHDFASGVPAGGIWTGVVNAGAGGMNSIAGSNVGVCTTCTWNTNGSGDFNGTHNWAPFIGAAPNGNSVTAVFGPAVTAASATVYTNTNVTLKELRFDNTNSYALSGSGSVTLDADSGNALINVLQGNHEIQADLILNDNVTATAAAGTSLNINTPVHLNGHTFTVSAGSTVNLNDGTIVGGSGAGAGQLLNDGILSGLTSLEGNLVQSVSGSFVVDVGAAPVHVSGAAALSGTLDVSLADGFVPTLGAAYPILTARSVTDLGLSLRGTDANLFRLQVGPGMVSLLAAGVPEPSSVALFACGLTAGALLRVRRREIALGAPRHTANRRLQRLLVAVILLALGSLAEYIYAQHPVPPGMLLETRHDDFGNDAMPHAMQHDYTTGSVPAGSFWTDIHNPTNGGDAMEPAFFVADGFDFNMVDKAGKLFVEDLGLHVNTNASLGTGWEGGRNDAALLYTEFPAQNDFDAVAKIDAQTAGNWSHAGIVARVAGPPVGRGPGDGGLDDAENFVTVGRFATDAADPTASILLRQNIVDGVEMGGEERRGANVAGNAYIRMTKIGGQFSFARSMDGTIWETFPDAQVVNTALNTTGNTIQVGIGYWTFGGGVTGNVEFDSFDLKIYGPGTVTTATWTGGAFASVQGSGDWNANGNWVCNIPGCLPNHNTVTVTLGQTANVTGPATVFNNQAVMASALVFNSTNKYSLSGLGSVTLSAESGASTIDVDQGSHEIQLDLALANPTTIDAAAGTQLDINNTLDFTNATAGNRTLSITGGGRVNINNNIDLPVTNAVVTVNGGHVGGNGRINGRLTNTGGNVSPGTSVGTLTIDGQFQQNAAGTLNVELGGTAVGQYDRLAIVGGLNGAILDGTLDVSLVNGFVPAVGNTFDVLTAAGGINNAGVISLHASDAPFYSLAVMSGTMLRLTVTNPISMGITGDFNNNGTVDAADYVLWRDGGTLQNDPTPGVQSGDYDVWRANFGRTGAGSAASISATVPEPCSVVLMLGVGVALVSRRGIRFAELSAGSRGRH